MSNFVEEDIFYILKNDAAISALVGDRVYALTLPQNEVFPAIQYQIISDTGDYVMDGEDGVNNTRMQIGAWADSYAAAKDLSEKIRAALSGYIGAAGVDIQAIFRVNEDPDLEELINGKNRFRISTDYLIHFAKL